MQAKPSHDVMPLNDHADAMPSAAAHLTDEFIARLEKHQRILFKVAYMYCRDRDDRQDLVQEMLIQAWRSYERFDGRVQFSTWMYRIAVNVAITHYRSEGRRLLVGGTDPQCLFWCSPRAYRQDYWSELKTRIARTIDFLRSVPAEQIDGTEDKDVVLPVTRVMTTYKGMQLLLGHSMPNVYFHTVTAYNLLRQAGVPVGKRDFLGNP